ALCSLCKPYPPTALLQNCFFTKPRFHPAFAWVKYYPCSAYRAGRISTLSIFAASGARNQRPSRFLRRESLVAVILLMCLNTGGGTGNAARRPRLQAPRALTQQGLNNLAAFTRLLGYIQHFYPGDEAQNANWPAVAAQGVAEVE